jgi:hypothetical protein
MLGAELAQPAIMAMLENQSIDEWANLFHRLRSSRPAPSRRLGQGRWAVATERNLESDERSNLAIQLATRAARVD